MLTLLEKINRSREELNVSISAITKETGLFKYHIEKLERGEITITKTIANGFKAAAGIDGVPWSDDEIEMYKEEMYIQDDLIKFDRELEVIAVISKLELCSTYCYDEDLSTLCDIFVMGYFFAIGYNARGVLLLKELETKSDNFSNEHLYRYNQIHGWLRQYEYYYNDSLAFYLKAENIEGEMKHKRKYLYYHIGFCYTALYSMPFGIKYLESALEKGIDFIGSKLYLSAHRLLATNYAKLKNREMSELHLSYVNKYLVNEDNIDLDNEMRFLLAKVIVYMNFGEHDKSLKYLDELYHDSCFSGDKNMQILCFYNKSLLYKDLGDYKEARVAARNGMELAENNKYWTTIFDALNKLLKIPTKKDAEHLEEVVILNLKEYGMNEIIILCYEALYNFYLPFGGGIESTINKAYECKKKAEDLYNTLMIGDVLI